MSKRVRSDLLPLVKLSRPTSSFVLLALYFQGVLLSAGGQIPASAFLPAIAMTAVITAGFAINDYTDRHIDAYAHVDRVIPRQLMSPRTVLYIGIAELLFATTIFLQLGRVHIFIGSVAIILVLSYDRLKLWRGLAGNLTLSGLVVLAMLYGALASGAQSFSLPLGMLITSVFLAILAREIIMDIQDMEVDAGHRFTIPIEYGSERAYFIASLLVALSMFFLLALSLIVGTPAALVLFAPLVIMGLVFSRQLTSSSPTDATRHIAKMKAWAFYLIIIVVLISRWPQ